MTNSKRTVVILVFAVSLGVIALLSMFLPSVFKFFSSSRFETEKTVTLYSIPCGINGVDYEGGDKLEASISINVRYDLHNFIWKGTLTLDGVTYELKKKEEELSENRLSFTIGSEEDFFSNYFFVTLYDIDGRIFYEIRAYNDEVIPVGIYCGEATSAEEAAELNKRIYLS